MKAYSLIKIAGENSRNIKEAYNALRANSTHEDAIKSLKDSATEKEKKLIERFERLKSNKKSDSKSLYQKAKVHIGNNKLAYGIGAGLTAAGVAGGLYYANQKNKDTEDYNNPQGYGQY